ncbi:MAG: putative inorganic carbon (HCO3(-)) transporter [Halioglobus sp.]
MRDVIITLMVFATLPFIVRNAYFGVLVWSWLSYMNPHRLCWGFAYTMPFAQIVAIVLLGSMVISTQEKKIPANALVMLWATFLAWLTFCAFMAVYQDLAFEQLDKVLKIQLITLVTMLLMNSMKQVNQLIWVIVFSIGFYSFKGGIFTLLTGGGFHVFGPDGSDIQENNALAVAVLMILPLMVYMQKFPPHRFVKTFMPYCIFFSMASVIGSQSRGAFLAILAVGGFFWLKSKSKFVTGLVFLILAGFTFMFMPQSWHDRMGSINDFEQDSSSMERIKAWEYAIGIANDRITGGGFNSWSMENYNKYAPGAKKAFVAHSVYFGVLNDGGWPGLGMLLGILFLMWRQLGRVISVSENDPDHADYNHLARMLQISMVAFMAGGAFLSLAYFDLAWHLMAITIVLTKLTVDLTEERKSIKRVRKLPPKTGTYGRRSRRSPGRA